MRGIAFLCVLVVGLGGGCGFDPEDAPPVKAFRAGERAKRKLLAVEKLTVERALKLFQFDHGRFPTTKEGLQALMKNPGLSAWRPYLTNPVSIQGLQYESDGKTFKLSAAD